MAFLVVFVVSMRLKFRPVQDAVRRLNRVTWNPQAMRTAGQPGASASVVRHVGRISGAQYETPVEVVETEDRFVIALPYGTSPDWLKNVLAAGSAVIVDDGSTYLVDDPEVVPAVIGNSFFPAKDQRSHRLFGIDDFLLLRRAEST
jgi:deazaflavin-dependent oxidoreductase (nitroreductase family)